MKAIRFFSLALFSIVAGSVFAKESINPTITPALFKYNQSITVTYDVTGTPLASLSTAYLWLWIPGKTYVTPSNVNPASTDTGKTNKAKFTKSVVSGKTFFSITFTPSDFITGDISAETQLGMLLKGNDWSNGQTTDFLTDFWNGDFQVKLTSPTQVPLFVNTGDDITITAETPILANYNLYVNNDLITSQNNTQNFSYTHSVTETSGEGVIKLVATSTADAASSETTFSYFISINSAVAIRPAGIIPGINYDSEDNTKVTLCLLAPDKSSVYVLGDFNDWKINPEMLMNKDGEYFWITLNGLTPNLEYGYQYLVDESITMADPYSDKVLSPDDQYIPATTYPNLKQFPAKALKDQWYFNRVSVFQTNQQPYAWQATGYTKPEKKDLIIYELLIRDFFADNGRNYQNLIDTISYFKRLGVNAIELMPIMEFSGNDSWGYNPNFMFAPDKYYGTKNKLKEFVDKCHENNIAVILDIAMNHQDLPNPYVMMDFDFNSFKPKPTNKWFNVNATHPFSVFYDMNHESSYTKDYLDTINYYWLHEYKVDGFRFDLSKGFTQKNNPSNVSAWGSYDASRVAILKRMADEIWLHAPEAYVILEHFADNTEEKELANYRVDEGKGMMLWGNLNYAYNQNTMGFADNSDFKWINYTVRGWEEPHVVGYMESHDEERLMYKNLQQGSSSGSYNVKDLNTALDRVKAASLAFYTIPGPKMLWQFGELGYDKSINLCSDGSVKSDCRVSAKPAAWDYLDDGDRYGLFKQTADLIRLRKTYDVFTDGEATIEGANTLLKQITLKNNPFTSTPSGTSEMNAQVAVNFDIVKKSISVSFSHTGIWYDYYKNGEEINVTSTPMAVLLAPGEYKLYTDVQIENPIITGINPEVNVVSIAIYPNPTNNILEIKSDRVVSELSLQTLQGVKVNPKRMNETQWDVHDLPPTLYVAEVHVSNKVYRIKLVKN